MTDRHTARSDGEPPAARGSTPAGYDASDYPRFSVTVDVAILSVVDERLHVLLLQRRDDPFAGAWALPGGFKHPDETLDEAAYRELNEETGIDASTHLSQFGAFGDPGRDPRDNIVTVGYLAVTPDVGEVVAGDEALEVQLVPVEEVLSGERPMAFDHEHIVRSAIERAAEQLEDTDLATAFVGPRFTLSELQSVYEAVWGDELDPANFRRSLAPTTQSASYVVPTGERGHAGPKGGRPPELFEAGDAWGEVGSPVRRSRRRITSGDVDGAGGRSK